MKKVLLSLGVASLLYGAGDSQAIVSEVTKLRKKYEECKAGQSVVKGVDPKLHNESLKKIQDLSREIAQKEGIVRSLERTLASRDRAYREMSARNKSLVQQIHTDKVSRQERESLKRAVIDAKAELALAQKELKGGSVSVGQIRQELREAKATIAALKASQKNPTKTVSTQPQPDKRIEAMEAQLVSANSTIIALKKQIAENSKHPNVVTKVVEPTEKLKTLQIQLSQAQTTIANLRSANTPKTAVKEKVVEKIVYKDRPVEKIVEKVVYKDRPVATEKVVTKIVEPTEKLKALQQELASARMTINNLRAVPAQKTVVKEKVVEKVVYKDRPIEKVVEKIVYKNRPVEKVVEKIVYKDRPVIQEKVVEKVVYKERPIEKTTEKSITKRAVDDAAQRRIDKLALELERAKSTNAKATKVTAPAVVKNEPVNKAAESAPKKTGSSSAYRMATNAPIYSAPHGRQVDTWEARRSFTAGPPSNGWVHITGYFVNRVWQRTQDGENLYVKESDVIRR